MTEKEVVINKKQIIYLLTGIFLVIAVFSLTIGRDLYMGHDPNLISFAIVNFAGYLFFMIMPVELVYIYFLSEGQNPYILLLISMATALTAQFLDYMSGYLVSKHIISQLIRQDRYEKAQNHIRKYGKISIFIFNVLPLSSPILVLAAGMLKYPQRHVFLYSMLGLLIKYIGIMMFFV